MSPRMFSSVDFPQPDGPMMATNSPASTLRSMARSAVVSTSSERNRRWTSASVIMGLGSWGLSAQDEVLVGLEARVGRGHDPLPGAQALQDLHLLGVAAADGDDAAFGAAALGDEGEGAS